DAPRSQVVLFLDWQSWWRDYGENPSWSRAQIPALLRRQCGRWFRTLKYRHRVSAMANDLVQAFRLRRDRRFPLSDLLAGTAFACPQRGETSRWQSVLPDLSLATRPVSQEKVKSFADHLLVDGRYVMGGEQLRHMQRIVTLCRQAGVELVLLELPLNQALERALPPGVRDEFLTLVRNLARDRGVDFVERDETPLDLQDADFLDFSHLSFQGAKRFTQVVTEKVIVPRLRARPFGR
ncbi:MAG: hypothetical protein ACE5GE_01825, partial [Phycisphaerae bacterium]